MSKINAKSLYRKLSSHMEGTFLEDDEGAIEAGINSHANVLVPSIRGSFGASIRSEGPVPIEAALSSSDKGSAKQRPILSFVVVYTMIFFNGCCFTAVVPSVPFYLQILDAPPSFLGWVVSFYSLGQIVGSPLGGWMTSKLSSKRILTISSTLGFLSSTLYSVAPAYMFILYSRLLTGISAGMEFTTELTFIAQNTSKKERTVFLASVTAVNVIGFILGPSLGGLLALLDVDIFGVKIDKYTGPGWLLACMFLIDIILVQFCFEDVASAENEGDEEKAADERQSLLDSKPSHDSYGGMTESLRSLSECAMDPNNALTGSERPPSLPLVVSLILVQFTVMCGFSVLETITSPLAQEFFGWDVQECNLLFTAGGMISLFAYVVFVVASKFISDRWLVLYALILCFIGFVLAIDWQLLEWFPESLSDKLYPYLNRFVAGYMVMNAGFMTGRPVTFALYSKLIGQKWQGQYLGWMVAGGSAARTLGPFAAVAMYYSIQPEGVNLLVLFGTVGVLHIACLVLVLIQWPNLLPVSNLSKSVR